jgi:membrane-bound lytic murein transglycosylase D
VKLLFACVFVLLLLINCQSTEELSDESLQVSKDVSAQEMAEPLRTPEDLDPVDLEQNFCRDDVYARYLTERYKEANPLSKKLKRYKSRVSRKRVRRQHEYDALHYANIEMNGPVAPYFGALPIVVNEQVEFWINYYKKRGRRSFLRWLVRGESVKDIVFPVLQEQGVPLELFYLAMIESGFNNGAYSRAAATGTWQFMRGTAKLYGMKINHWVDERRDPVKSTLAAATFLKDLYAQLGDWYLAMAAYNAGPGRVRRAIRKTGSRDFWKLAKTSHLHRETSNYVPKVLAAILLASDPVEHGFVISSNPMHRMPETSVHLKKPVMLSEVASELGIPLKTLRRWNPEITRDITPPSKEGYRLRMNTAFAERFAEIEPNLSVIEVTEVHMHKVRSGDTLSQIARRYKVRIGQILQINPKLRARALRIGKQIAIPVPGVITKKAG